jgi:hypothetical protein
MSEESANLLYLWITDLYNKSMRRPLSYWEADHYQLYARRHTAHILDGYINLGRSFSDMDGWGTSLYDSRNKHE